MSALAGICYWDQRPVAAADRDAMAAASRRAGPDGGGTVSPIPGLTMQAHVLHFDRRSTTERQPWTFGNGSVLTWDGRLDNRDELFVRLHRDLREDHSDVAIVAAAYARWGLDCFPMLIGDWSLVLWEAAHQQIILASDYMGNRPLYYIHRPEFVAWATCLEALLDGCHVGSDVDEDYIAATLTSTAAPEGITPFARVRMLPAAHRMIVTREGANQARYWKLSPETVRYRRLDDYTDHLRELLIEAVRVRLRSNGTVWPHLSGGWDSSSIVCLAHRLIASGHVEAPAIQPLSLVWPGSPEYDETDFIRAVERWCGLATISFDFQGFCTIDQLLAGQRRPLGWHRFTLERLVQNAGDRVVMSGLGGDAVMVTAVIGKLALLEHLYQGHPIRFLKQCAASAQRAQVSFLYTVGRLFWTAYRSESPAQYTRLLQRRFSSAPLVTARLLARREALPTPDLPRLADFPTAKRRLVVTLDAYARKRALTSPDSIPELWWTYPFVHRPLVEFTLAAPSLALWDASELRAGMKRALADILAPEILGRLNKGNGATPWERAKRRVAEEIGASKALLGPAERWHVVNRDYVSRNALAHALADPPANNPSIADALMKCIDIEMWLRTITQTHGPAASRVSSTATQPLRLSDHITPYVGQGSLV